jgi:hypothetical protein
MTKHPLDDKYPTCFDCAHAFEAHQLKAGRCADCHRRFLEEREVIVAKANERALSSAARQILAGISSAPKGELFAPAFLDGAMRKLGGPEKFGEICAEEFMKCRGVDPATGQKPAGGTLKEYPQLAVKWGEMLARVGGRNDERETGSVANFTEDELLTTLQSLSMDLVQNSEDYCEATLEAILQKRPELLDRAMNAAGKPVAEGEVVPEAPKIAGIDFSEIGIDDGEPDIGDEDDDE